MFESHLNCLHRIQINMSQLKTNRITNFLLFFFTAFGLWPPKHAVFYKIYGILFQFVFSFLFSVFMCINLFILENKGNMTDALHMSLTEVALFIKVVNFFVRGKAMQTMLRTIQEFKLENLDEERIIDEKLSFFLKVSIYYYGMANMAGFSGDFAALVAKDVRLPFQGWYPLDWKHNRLSYWIVFVYQGIGMFITSNLNITIELFPMFLMFMISAKVEILGRRLQMIGYQNHQIDSDEAPSPNKASLLINCIKTHEHICK